MTAVCDGIIESLERGIFRNTERDRRMGHFTKQQTASRGQVPCENSPSQRQTRS